MAFESSFRFITSEVRTIVTASCRTIMSTTPSCVSDRELVNSRLKTLSGAKPCVFAVARLDPESGRQDLYETVARFHIKIGKKLPGLLHFLKMRLTIVHETVAELDFT